MKKKKTFAYDGALRTLETILANQVHGGAAGYARQRTLSYWWRGLCSLSVIALPAYIQWEFSRDAGDAISWMVAVAIFAVFCVGFAISTKCRQYVWVHADLGKVRAAIDQARALGLIQRFPSFSNLQEMLAGMADMAHDAAKQRSGVEKSIERRDVQKSAALKRALTDLIAAGTIVEQQLRLQECDWTLDRWDSPVRWPGETAQRSYVLGSKTGKPGIALGKAPPVRVRSATARPATA
jgi:hypothetical protein